LGIVDLLVIEFSTGHVSGAPSNNQESIFPNQQLFINRQSKISNTSAPTA
jgi:hypothetical protein